LSFAALDILLNHNILKINQDLASTPVSPFKPLPPPNATDVEDDKDGIPKYWTGLLAGGETVLMIINTDSKPKDITFSWRQIPTLQDSHPGPFYFVEVSTRRVWRGAAFVGFKYASLPPHDNLVFVIWQSPSGALEEQDDHSQGGVIDAWTVKEDSTHGSG
jgi:hypothetical protein